MGRWIATSLCWLMAMSGADAMASAWVGCRKSPDVAGAEHL
ncbi:hypothetical protein ACOJBM_41830 [Rhizobium beringeri]